MKSLSEKNGGVFYERWCSNLMTEVNTKLDKVIRQEQHEYEYAEYENNQTKYNRLHTYVV